MFDILLYLFESYFDLGRYPDHDKLSLKLTAAGFEEDDINQALLWLLDLQKLNSTSYPAKINHQSTRVYSEFEQERISPQSLHFLSFWKHAGVISSIEHEMIIDRAIALNRKNLPLDRLKLIVLMVLWNQHEDLDPMLMEDLLVSTELTQLH